MTTAKTLAEGLYFGEGPRWHGGRLWFSDFYEHAVKSMDSTGAIRTDFEIDDQPSGLGWLPDGRLLVVAMHRRQLLRVDADGVKLHADLSGLATYHCNDMVVDAQGRAYVGNFGFALDEALESRGVESVIADHPTARCRTAGSGPRSACARRTASASMPTATCGSPTPSRPSASSLHPEARSWRRYGPVSPVSPAHWAARTGARST
jgi:hypothetical protein